MESGVRDYYAKSANDYHGKISNREHLQRVGGLARIFGAELGKRMQQVSREIFMTSGNTPCGFRACSRAPIRGLTTPFRVLQSCTGD